MLLVVTERRSAFVGVGERNQRWVDGGLFAMSVVLSLHAQGLASCFLNWSQTVSATQELRARSGIPKTEDVIVLIAVGWPAEQARVARSPLRAVDDWLVEH
jgi:Nitroreductase family.